MKLPTLIDAFTMSTIIVLMLVVSGCVVGKHGDSIYGSIFKDISAKGSVEVKPDGTKVYHVDVTSDTAGGAMIEAIKVVRP